MKRRAFISALLALPGVGLLARSAHAHCTFEVTRLPEQDTRQLINEITHYLQAQRYNK